MFVEYYHDQPVHAEGQIPTELEGGAYHGVS